MSNVVLPKKFSRTPAAPRTLLTQKQIDTCSSTAEVIRLCVKEGEKMEVKPTNGEIARFLGIRPQWVFNVINNPPKGK